MGFKVSNIVATSSPLIILKRVIILWSRRLILQDKIKNYEHHTKP